MVVLQVWLAVHAVHIVIEPHCTGTTGGKPRPDVTHTPSCVQHSPAGHGVFTSQRAIEPASKPGNPPSKLGRPPSKLGNPPPKPPAPPVPDPPPAPDPPPVAPPLHCPDWHDCPAPTLHALQKAPLRPHSEFKLPARHSPVLMSMHPLHAVQAPETQVVPLLHTLHTWPPRPHRALLVVVWHWPELVQHPLAQLLGPQLPLPPPVAVPPPAEPPPAVPPPSATVPPPELVPPPVAEPPPVAVDPPVPEVPEQIPSVLQTWLL